jgi:hypothetical protein
MFAVLAAIGKQKAQGPDHLCLCACVASAWVGILLGHLGVYSPGTQHEHCHQQSSIGPGCLIAGYAVYRQLQSVGWVRAATKRRAPRGAARSAPCLLRCNHQCQQANYSFVTRFNQAPAVCLNVCRGACKLVICGPDCCLVLLAALRARRTLASGSRAHTTTRTRVQRLSELGQRALAPLAMSPRRRCECSGDAVEWRATTIPAIRRPQSRQLVNAFQMNRGSDE